MNKNDNYSLALTVVFIFNLFLIFLVEFLTFKIYPGSHISGNGNPVIILWFIEIPAYILLLTLIVLGRNRNFIKFISSGYILLINTCLLLINVYYQYALTIDIYRNLEARLDDRYSIINAYTNTVFINFHNFSIGILIILLAAGLFWRFKIKNEVLK